MEARASMGAARLGQLSRTHSSREAQDVVMAGNLPDRSQFWQMTERRVCLHPVSVPPQRGLKQRDHRGGSRITQGFSAGHGFS
jgi:hypothetical protein